VLQIRAGDLVAIQKDDLYVVVAILTPTLLLGGRWCFVAHNAWREMIDEVESSSGFNAFIDFIVPKREGRIARIRRNADFSTLQGPELLQQPPLKGEKNYRIWRWKDHRREAVEYLHFTSSPTVDEKSSPHYSTIPADFAWALASRAWTPRQSMWIAAE
jgi:hypothetical protein